MEDSLSPAKVRVNKFHMVVFFDNGGRVVLSKNKMPVQFHYQVGINFFKMFYKKFD